MGINELSLEQLTGFAREQFGLDFDLDRIAMAKLAAIGLTMHAWRNASVRIFMPEIIPAEDSPIRT
jgi:hypothetical protein